MGQGNFDNTPQDRVARFAADFDRVATDDSARRALLRNEPERRQGSGGKRLARLRQVKAAVGRVAKKLRDGTITAAASARDALRTVAQAPAQSPEKRREANGAPRKIDDLFGDDYWPGRNRPTRWRLAVGVFASPLATLGPTLALALVLYWFSESDQATAWSMTLEAAADFFSALYAPLLIGAAVGGATLWALRLRSKRAFALFGGVLGALGGGVVYLIDGALPPVVAIYTLCAGALSMLALRWAAGVRKLG